MYETTELRRALENRKGRADQAREDLKKVKRRIAELEREERLTEKAQIVIQEVARLTQEELEYHVSEITSLSLDAIFPDPYALKLEFAIRRGKTEADIMFERNGELFHPLSASGGGPVDVAAFGLRTSLWSLARPRSRNVLVLDEPFRFLSKNLQPRAADMLKEVSTKLGLQLVILTHETELIEKADRVFSVSIKNGRTQISS